MGKPFNVTKIWMSRETDGDNVGNAPLIFQGAQDVDVVGVVVMTTDQSRGFPGSRRMGIYKPHKEEGSGWYMAAGMEGDSDVDVIARFLNKQKNKKEVSLCESCEHGEQRSKFDNPGWKLYCTYELPAVAHINAVHKDFQIPTTINIASCKRYEAR